METTYEVKSKINTMYTHTATAYFQGFKFIQNNIEINCNIPVPEKNWAFLDMQNLYKGVREKGWKIDWVLFREYLKKKLFVTKAIIFMGYIKKNKRIYKRFKKAGFILEFREVFELADGTIDGGNVDADLASYTMDYKNDYHQAVIVADDGDYCRTIESLIRQDKLKLIISSHTICETSNMIKRIASKLILSIQALRPFIEFKQKEF